MFAFTNISQMPSYLSESFFDDWYVNFNNLLIKLRLPKFIYSRFNISIQFSDEKKKKRYGTLTIEELKQIIQDTWGSHKEIEEILDRIDTFDDYRKLLQELVGVVYRIYPDKDCNNPEDLYSLLDELEFEIAILGEYDNYDKTITLYSANIEKAAGEHAPENTYAREFEKIFIHELFHAYHYYNDPEELIKRRDYTCKVVKESLASAFEWYYCEENKINGNDDLRDSWRNYPILNYPYSGAKELISSTGGFVFRYYLDDKKFCNVFDISLNDMDSALRVLLRSCDFYRIKNATKVYEKKIVVSPKDCDTYADFYAAMEKKTVGQIVREEIPPIITTKKYLIAELLDRSYCKKTFNLDTYTVLAITRIYSTPHYRYYPDITNVDATDYYICSQWYEKHRKNLLDWIWIHR